MSNQANVTIMLLLCDEAMLSARQSTCNRRPVASPSRSFSDFIRLVFAVTNSILNHDGTNIYFIYLIDESLTLNYLAVIKPPSTCPS